jgi:hypothetical protein
MNAAYRKKLMDLATRYGPSSKPLVNIKPGRAKIAELPHGLDVHEDRLLTCTFVGWR